MRIVKKYWLPLLALVLAIGLAVWRIGYLERTNTSLSMEIGSREALQNGEPITLENPVILYKNEPYVPLKEIVERLGGTTDGKTYTLHGAETVVSGVERNGVLYTPFSYLWDSHIPQIRWDKSRNRVIITEAPDEIPVAVLAAQNCARTACRRQRSTVPRSVRLTGRTGRNDGGPAACHNRKRNRNRDFHGTL